MDMKACGLREIILGSRNCEYGSRNQVYLDFCRAFVPLFFRVCFSFLFIPMLLFMPLGCSHPGPNVYASRGYGQAKVRKIAVFPFRNNTKAAEASKMVTAAFMAGLVETRRFQVEFPGTVRSFLVSERIIVRTGVDLNTISVMSKRLGVDAVILGQVEEYVGAEKAGGDALPVVSISSRMVDSETGRIMWMAQHRRTGDDYTKILDLGRVRSVGALARNVVGEMIETMP